MSAVEFLAVVAALSAAAAYLAFRARRFFRPANGAGCCGKCPVVRSSTTR